MSQTRERFEAKFWARVQFNPEDDPLEIWAVHDENGWPFIYGLEHFAKSTAAILNKVRKQDPPVPEV